MKTYVKTNDIIYSLNKKIKIFSSISDIPATLSNEIVLVENNGIYLSNLGTNTVLYTSQGGGGAEESVGTIKAIKYGLAKPNGWLRLRGEQFDQNLYPALYNLLGTNILPDFRELTPIGMRAGVIGYFIDDTIPAHTHTIACDDLCHSHNIEFDGRGECHCHTAPFGFPAQRSQAIICYDCHSECVCYASNINYSGTTGPAFGVVGDPISSNNNKVISGLSDSCHPISIGIYGANYSRDLAYGVEFIIYAGV